MAFAGLPGRVAFAAEAPKGMSGREMLHVRPNPIGMLH